ncbi:MAG: hypothetical protein ABWJ42_02755 [Sulfolobales archaeon]
MRRSRYTPLEKRRKRGAEIDTSDQLRLELEVLFSIGAPAS